MRIAGMEVSPGEVLSRKELEAREGPELGSGSLEENTRRYGPSATVLKSHRTPTGPRVKGRSGGVLGSLRHGFDPLCRRLRRAPQGSVTCVARSPGERSSQVGSAMIRWGHEL